MSSNRTQISVKGRQIEVPLVQVGGFDIVTTGRWLRMAAIKDEDYTETAPSLNPEPLIAGFRSQNVKADIFSFAQRLPDTLVRHPFPMCWDNAAAVPLTTFSDWWKSLPQASRKNVRRSERRGIVVGVSPLNQTMAQGIKSIYDESPVRQGRPFWHYGKNVETVLRENATYPERCDFITAYYNEELVGFIKMVYVGKTAQIMQIISKNRHYDKRPANALIAKAVEVCCQKGMSFFVYGKYVYGSQADSALVEFKRRNGFQQFKYPRYYVPLTFKGALAIKLNFHLGIRSLLPKRVESLLLEMRSKYYASRQPADGGVVDSDPKDELAGEGQSEVKPIAHL
jgi:hypothetical protein